MRKFIVFILFSACIFVAKAQITNLYLFKKNGNIIDSSLVVNDIYFGSLSGTNFSVKNFDVSTFSNIRVGAMLTYNPTKWFSVKTMGCYQTGSDGLHLAIPSFSFKVKPFKKFDIEFGSVATIPTEQRPLPATGNGHFETWSESQIPGGALNAKIKFQMTKNLETAGGIAYRDNLLEYSGRIVFKQIKLSGWYSNDTIFGAAMTTTFPKIYNILVFKKDIIADFISIKINEGHEIFLYSDMGYNLELQKLVRGEWGLLKCFESQWAKGLVGLGYQHEFKTINGYLFFHL